MVRTKSARGLDALQDAGATDQRPRERERAASWTAAALRRFARARRLRIKETHSPHEKAPAGWTHSKTLARLTSGPASAQRLGLRRPSAALPARDAYVLRKRIVRTKSARGLDALQDAGATDQRPRERAASWRGGPSASAARQSATEARRRPPLSPAHDANAETKRLLRAKKRRRIGAPSCWRKQCPNRNALAAVPVPRTVGPWPQPRCG
jgi:hypothetical protein